MLDAYRAADSNGVACYEMFVVNPILSPEPHSMFRGNNRELGKGSSYTTFEEHLDRLLDNPDIASIRVKIWGQKKSDEKADLTITIRTPYNDRDVVRYYPERTPERDRTQTPTVQPVQQSQQSQQTSMSNKNVGSLLGLLGLGGMVTGGLGAIDDDATGGLCAILDVRDRLKEQEFERVRQDERSRMAEEALKAKEAEIMQLKSQLQTMGEAYNAQLSEYQRQLEKNTKLMKEMQERCDEAEAVVERVNPNNSIFGVALSGLLANCGQMLIRRNAGLLGGLMGVDKDTFTAMLDGEESDPNEPNTLETPSQQQEQTPVEVQPMVESVETDIIAPEVMLINEPDSKEDDDDEI